MKIKTTILSLLLIVPFVASATSVTVKCPANTVYNSVSKTCNKNVPAGSYLLTSGDNAGKWSCGSLFYNKEKNTCIPLTNSKCVTPNKWNYVKGVCNSGVPENGILITTGNNAGKWNVAKKNEQTKNNDAQTVIKPTYDTGRLKSVTEFLNENPKAVALMDKINASIKRIDDLIKGKDRISEDLINKARLKGISQSAFSYQYSVEGSDIDRQITIEQNALLANQADYQILIDEAKRKYEAEVQEKKFQLAEKYGYSLDSNEGTIVGKNYGCDYIVINTVSGYSFAQVYSGFFYQGDGVYGDFNQFGFHTIKNNLGTEGSIWISDILLTRTSAMDKFNDKCN